MINRVFRLIRFLGCGIRNYFTRAQIILIIEDADWVIKSEGIYYQSFLRKKGLRARLAVTAWGSRNKVVHFMSVNTFITTNGFKLPHPSNRIGVTWYHSEFSDPRLSRALELSQVVSFLHTSCEITKQLLIQSGAQKDKIVVIPIGIDLNVFKTSGIRSSLRSKLGISESQFVIGSFQKDGVGWGEGLEPKLVKGPDTFCKVIERLPNKDSLHVLLTGPARGYVISRLKNMGVAYSHIFLEKPEQVREYYEALDVYLIASRVEGGPKALGESWGMQVPLVSTRVGMVQDFAIHLTNAFLADVDDVVGLAAGIETVREKDPCLQTMVSKGQITAQKFSYENTIAQFAEVYRSLISSLKP